MPFAVRARWPWKSALLGAIRCGSRSKRSNRAAAGDGAGAAAGYAQTRGEQARRECRCGAAAYAEAGRCSTPAETSPSRSRSKLAGSTTSSWYAAGRREISVAAGVLSITAREIEQTINLKDPEDAVKYMPSLFVRKRNDGDNQAVLATRTWGPTPARGR